MSVLKYVELSGESKDGWTEAAQDAVSTASRTIRQIRHIEVTRLTARAELDGSLVFQTTLKLAFHVERADEEDEALALQQAVEIVNEESMP